MDADPIVLLVEDDRDYAALVSAVLGVGDWQVEHAADLAAALTFLRAGAPACVLLDLGLPDAVGTEAIPALLDACHAPIVVLSGRDDDEALRRARHAGAQDFVLKGGELDGRLDAAVHRAVRHGRVRTAAAAVRATSPPSGRPSPIARMRAIGRRLARSARLADAHHHAIFEQALVGMCITATDGTLLDVNDAYCAIVGRSRDELRRTHWRELTHPADAPEDELRHQEVIDGLAEGYQLDKRYVRPDGSIVWVSLSTRLIRDAAGRPAQFSTQIVDVSAHRESEERLVESEQRMRTMLSALHDGVVLLGADGVIAEANDAAVRMLSADMLRGSGHPVEPGRMVVDADGRPVARDARPMTRALRTGRPSHGELVLMRQPDGSVRTLSVNNMPIAFPGEAAPRGVVAALSDVTERVEAERALSESVERHKQVLANMPGTLITVYDADLRITDMEGNFELDPGVTVADLIGLSLHDVVDDEAVALLRPPMLAALAGESATVDWIDASGRALSIEVVPYRDGDGLVCGVMNVARDVTAELDARRRFSVAFADAPIGMLLGALDGSSLEVNAAFGQILGYSADELRAMPPLGFIHPDDLPAAQEATAGLFSGGTMTMEHRCLDAEGNVVWVLARGTLLRNAGGEATDMLVQMQDITARRTLEDRLRHMADHDALTGLVNRRGFERALSTHIAAVRRYDAGGAVLVLDLDGFKRVNDTLGHLAGDELIIACGRAMTERLRGSDVLARLGGDEFGVLLPAGDHDDALVVAEALVQCVRDVGAAYAGTAGRAVTVSAGLAAFCDHEHTADGVMRAADAAMYAAKTSGRDRVALA